MPALTCTALGAAVILGVVVMSGAAPHYPRKTSVAHRGASAYAPEHTLAAYRLALEQGADFVEQDLAVTRDGILICLHDPSLERTTDVEARFPDRFTEVTYRGEPRKVWLANDFTLAEIKRLDAGSWFGEAFRGERVPTFDEAVELVKGRAGLFPELKTPDLYQGRDVHFEELVAAALDRHGLRGPAADPKTPIILQTFGEESARKLAAMPIGVPVALLIPDEARWDRARMREWKGIVQDLAPSKSVLAANPDFVTWAHEEGFTVTPYTFSASSPGRFPSVRAEMEHFLYTLGVDALFTDNPDQFPRR